MTFHMFGMGGRNTIALSFVAGAMVGSQGFAPTQMVGSQDVDRTPQSQDIAPTVADTFAFQMKVRTNYTEKAVTQIKTGMWVSGDAGTNACPSGSTPISQDECEAFAMMDMNPSLWSVLMAPFPQSNPMFPKGCSIMPSGNQFRYFIYNTHPTGAGSQMILPACKNDPWEMFKSACPAGKISVSESECIAFSSDKHHYVWSGTINSATNPPGCFGVGENTFVDSSEVGKVYYNLHATGSLTNPLNFPVCTGAPGAPTPPPTAAPSAGGSGGGGGSTSAVGDPHMTTIFGSKFDIMRAGTHVLLQIPQGADAADSLLRVQVAVQHEGAKCEDMYIRVLNITGMWAEDRVAGGLSFVAERPGGSQTVAPTIGVASWMRLGMVSIKVVRGSTTSGSLYLNMYAKNLHATSGSYRIGGILGLDDYTEAATPAAECDDKVLSLLSSVEQAPRLH